MVACRDRLRFGSRVKLGEDRTKGSAGQKGGIGKGKKRLKMRRKVRIKDS